MKITKRASAFCLLFSLTAALVSTHQANADKTDFELPALSTFDGTQWDAIQLGTSTGTQIKDHYKIAKTGNVIPWSLMISTPRGSGERLNVLFGGRDDKKDVATALLIRYDAAPTLESIKKDFGHAGESYYQRGRTSGWLMHVYRDKGVILFTVYNGQEFVVPAVLLTPPAGLQDGCLGFTDEATLIERVVDPHANEPRIMYFGNVDVSVTTDGMNMSDAEKSNLKDDLRGATAGGTMLYQEYARGECDATVHAVYKADKGDCIDVTVTIDGASPYGPIHAAGSSSVTYKDHTRYTDSAEYTSVFHEALRRAQQEFVAQIHAQGPPSPDMLRDIAWDDVFNRLRTASISAEGGHTNAPPGSLWAVAK